MWKSLAFFSRKFTCTQKKYSAYDRELTAIFEAVKYFCYFLEGHEFHTVTDHISLVFIFSKNLKKASPRQQRQLSFLSQFTNLIEYLPGETNVVDDSLSWIDALSIPSDISLLEFSEAQKENEQPKKLYEMGGSSLNLRKFIWGTDHTSTICNVLGESHPLYVPPTLRKRFMALFHNPAHSSGNVTGRIIWKRCLDSYEQRYRRMVFNVCTLSKVQDNKTYYHRSL